jgi:hypothetical protein
LRIITRFDNLNDIRRASIVIDMPHAVREGDFVELGDESFRVLNVTWVIEPGKPTELVARVK